jgi:circadian clock protein KaiC
MDSDYMTKKIKEKKTIPGKGAKIKQKKDDKNKPKHLDAGYFLPEVTGLKDLFTHGIPIGSAVIIEGGPGSGKTIFCLQACVSACKQGKKTLFMSFEEPEKRLREHLAEWDFDPTEYEKKGLLRIKRFNALDVARSVEALLSEAKKELLIDVQPVLIPQDFKPDIIFVDSVTSISSAFSGESSRFRVYMEQFFRYLEANTITSFLIMETPHPTHLGNVISGVDPAVSFLSDGIMVIYSVIHENGRRGRALEVLKMRGEHIDRKIVEMEIIPRKGFTIFPNKILTGKYILT